MAILKITDIKLTYATLLSAAIAGSVGYWTGTSYTRVELVSAVPIEMVELLTADKAVLLAEATTSKAEGRITCAVGVITNHLDECYCTDGDTAGWLTKAADCKSEIEIINGKVYVMP